MGKLSWDNAVYLSFRTAFFSLLETKPIGKITVLELSEKAGYARSTFYQYFNDVLELDEIIRTDILYRLKEQINSYSSPARATTKILVRESTYDIYHWFLACQTMRKELLTYLYYRPNINFLTGIRKQLMGLVKRMAKYDDLPDDRETEYYLYYQVEGTVGMLVHFLKNHPDEDPAAMVYVFNGYHRYLSWFLTGSSKEVRDSTLEMMADILDIQRQQFTI